MEEEIPRRGRVMGSVNIDELPDALKALAAQVDHAAFGHRIRLAGAVVVSAAPGIAAGLGDKSMREALVAIPLTLAATAIGTRLGYGAGKAAVDKAKLEHELGREVGRNRHSPLIGGFLAQGATHVIAPGDNKLHFVTAPHKEGELFRPLFRHARSPIPSE